MKKTVAILMLIVLMSFMGCAPALEIDTRSELSPQIERTFQDDINSLTAYWEIWNKDLDISNWISSEENVMIWNIEASRYLYFYNSRLTSHFQYEADARLERLRQIWEDSSKEFAEFVGGHIMHWTGEISTRVDVWDDGTLIYSFVNGEKQRRH